MVSSLSISWSFALEYVLFEMTTVLPLSVSFIIISLFSCTFFKACLCLGKRLFCVVFLLG